MGEVAYRAICQLFGGFFAAVVLLPAGIMLAAWLLYIMLLSIREWRKK